MTPAMEDDHGNKWKVASYWNHAGAMEPSRPPWRPAASTASATKEHQGPSTPVRPFWPQQKTYRLTVPPQYVSPQDLVAALPKRQRMPKPQDVITYHITAPSPGASQVATRKASPFAAVESKKPAKTEGGTPNSVLDVQKSEPNSSTLSVVASPSSLCPGSPLSTGAKSQHAASPASGPRSQQASAASGPRSISSVPQSNRESIPSGHRSAHSTNAWPTSAATASQHGSNASGPRSAQSTKARSLGGQSQGSMCTRVSTSDTTQGDDIKTLTSRGSTGRTTILTGHSSRGNSTSTRSSIPSGGVPHSGSGGLNGVNQDQFPFKPPRRFQNLGSPSSMNKTPLFNTPPPSQGS